MFVIKRLEDNSIVAILDTYEKALLKIIFYDSEEAPHIIEKQ